jgi:hypothetical protein
MLFGRSPIGIRPTMWEVYAGLLFRVVGSTYFFTVNLLERRLDTLVRHIAEVNMRFKSCTPTNKPTKTRRLRPFLTIRAEV